MKNFALIIVGIIIGLVLGVVMASVIESSYEDCEVTGKLLHKSARTVEMYLVIELSPNQTAEYKTKKKIGRPLVPGTWYTFTYQKSIWSSEEVITKAIATVAPPER